MKSRTSHFVLFVVTALLPAAAFAHSIPPIMVGLALSPLVALLLACVYGIMAGRWKVLVLNLALIALWTLLFGLAAANVTSDFVIWSPIVAMLVHIVALLVLIVLRLVARSETAD